MTLQKDLLFDSDDPEGRFKQLSDKERRKFDEETLVNLNNREKETITSQEVKDQPKNTYMVVSLWFDYWELDFIILFQDLLVFTPTFNSFIFR